MHFEHASLSAHHGTLPTLAQPLPQLRPLPDLTPGPDGLPRYSVVICGAGPAGMFSTLLLTRYGIPCPHILTVDASTTRTAGHADGIFARTQEVLASLGLVDEIDRCAGEAREQAQWNYHLPSSQRNGEATDPRGMATSLGSGDANGNDAGYRVSPGFLAEKADLQGGVKRAYVRPFETATSRFKGAFRTLAQGRVERILEDDLLKHGGEPIVRGARVVGVEIDEADAEFPVRAELEDVATGRTERVRCKYLIGADGAHSAVRRSLNVKMEGDTLDDVWGVLDFVPDTDFPDTRRVFMVTHPKTFLLHVPREMSHSGKRLSRMYVLFDQEESGKEVKTGLKADVEEVNTDKEQLKAAQASLRKHITLEKILERVKEILSPYRVDVKKGTEVEWWAAYQVGRRVSERMIVPDAGGHPRVFLMGDASHTHSPKLGQGMNVSLMDAYDLTWKLAHDLMGLAPNPRPLLETYEIDRRDNELNLISIDKRWYAARYSKYQDQLKDTAEWISPKWDEIKLEMASFITGTAVEYNADTFGVDKRRQEGTGKAGEVDGYSMGVLREGRRLADDAILKRFVDGIPVDLQAQCASNGTYKIIAYATNDLLRTDGQDQQALLEVCKIVQTAPDKMVQLVVVHPLEHFSFEWSDLPAVLKDQVHNYLFSGAQSVYKKYGVDVEQGLIAVVRPDQYIGSIADLAVGAEGTQKVEQYLQRMLASKA